ncbi:MAG: polymer-forming cytoskeletal protein [Bacteroidia bacterium]|nr:polymer-forming cytoskeletal protein [Bacteroidia bacterium]
MAKDNVVETVASALNLVGPGTKFTGDVVCDGDMRIDGHLKGNIVARGKLVVGQTGTIQGEINCKNFDVSGVIDGIIKVAELLSLKSTSKIHGEIITNKLAIEPGAVFTGKCSMDGGTGNKPEIKEPEKPVK